MAKGKSQSLVRPKIENLFSFSDLVIIFNKIFNLNTFWDENYFRISWVLKCIKNFCGVFQLKHFNPNMLLQVYCPIFFNLFTKFLFLCVFWGCFLFCFWSWVFHVSLNDIFEKLLCLFLCFLSCLFVWAIQNLSNFGSSSKISSSSRREMPFKL